ncbi:hypothetical protein FACS1894211_08720 [Clostridia bacterium]|nr:hypothetical protein FACS1894211_08720 [Clostridia bacterium]
MIRIGILGSENSHADAFAAYFNVPLADGRFRFPDIRVTAVCGDYPESNRELAEKYGLESIAERPEDMAGRVDAAAVTARDGRRHAAFARPCIARGMPVWIDKPFTADPREAESLARFARDAGAPLAGGSSLKDARELKPLQKAVAQGAARGGAVSAPIFMNSEYGGFWFYASHAVELCLSTFGWAPAAVTARRNACGAAAIFHYSAFDVTVQFLEHCYESYSVTVFTERGNIVRPVNAERSCDEECARFARLLRTGKPLRPDARLVAPVRCIAAIEHSFQTGAAAPIFQP